MFDTEAKWQWLLSGLGQHPRWCLGSSTRGVLFLSLEFYITRNLGRRGTLARSAAQGKSLQGLFSSHIETGSVNV